jgi:hypothetical protein
MAMESALTPTAPTARNVGDVVINKPYTKAAIYGRCISIHKQAARIRTASITGTDRRPHMQCCHIHAEFHQPGGFG